MKQRYLTLGLTGGCIVLAVAAFVINAGKDSKAPEITVKKGEVTYTEGDSYEALLEGISAEDDSDGDLSDKVFVDWIVQTGEDTAIVYYGVVDSHNNVGTAKKKITYITSENSGHADAEGDTPANQPEEDQTAQEPQEVL